MSNEFRKFRRLLNNNGYRCDRIKGSHYIFENKNGRTITINRNPNRMVMQRLIAENNLRSIDG